MTKKEVPGRVFRPARSDAASAAGSTPLPQTTHPAYRLAFQDNDFLLRDDLRPVRFQLELLKAQTLLDEAQVHSTFVFYGSARIPEAVKAEAIVAAATTDTQRRHRAAPAGQGALLRGGTQARPPRQPRADQCRRQPRLRRVLGRRPLDHGGGESRGR